MNVPITIKGPNGMYSSIFLIFVVNNITLNIAPIKNETSVIAIIFDKPKYNPNAPISFTSPNPIASFPYIAPPINVISRNIPPPASIPSAMFIAIATSDNPYRNAITKPISNIVKFSLFGIICNL